MSWGNPTEPRESLVLKRKLSRLRDIRKGKRCNLSRRGDTHLCARVVWPGLGPLGINMQNHTSDRSAIRPETTNQQDSEPLSEDNVESERPRPALSLVSDSPETTEDKAAMEMYAAMLPRSHILGSIRRRHLVIAGGFGLLLIGLALARHLPASNAAASLSESGPVVSAAAAALTPAVPAIPAATPTTVPAPAAAPVLVAVAQEPEPVAQPAPEPAAPSSIRAAEAQDLEGCRQAIKRRDIKLVSASCESALNADASLAKPLLALARAQFEKGKSAQAAVWARKIVQVNGSLADAYLIIGAAEQEARHPAAAKTAYQRYLELAPRGPYAEDVRSSLKSL
jgi:hypothetical protein